MSGIYFHLIFHFLTVYLFFEELKSIIQPNNDQNRSNLASRLTLVKDSIYISEEDLGSKFSFIKIRGEDAEGQKLFIFG